MKRFLCAVLVSALVLLCAACSSRVLSQGDTSPTPTSSSTSRGEPVEVTELHANSDTVEATAPAPSSNAEPVATPDTGDLPIVPLAGAIGLILICSAGLVLLKRI